MAEFTDRELIDWCARSLLMVCPNWDRITWLARNGVLRETALSPAPEDSEEENFRRLIGKAMREDGQEPKA